MTKTQEFLAMAAKELGVRIEIGYVARLDNGRTAPSQALLPDLGGKKGMLVFSSDTLLDQIARRYLAQEGFALSTYSEPLPNEVFDIDGYAEMFSDWGWNGDANLRPAWMDSGCFGSDEKL